VWKNQEKTRNALRRGHADLALALPTGGEADLGAVSEGDNVVLVVVGTLDARTVAGGEVGGEVLDGVGVHVAIIAVLLASSSAFYARVNFC